jgi:arylsulfatase A-like enzyme
MRVWRQAGDIQRRGAAVRGLVAVGIVGALGMTAGPPGDRTCVVQSVSGLDTALPTLRRPNILVVFTDDHGWTDLTAQGVDDDIRTPNFDTLAAAGVRFSRGYVTAPQCVPSRAGVLTGIHQSRFGVEDNQQGPLPHAVVTLPERLKKLGYVTGMSGKWHLDVSHERAEQGGAKADPEFLPHRHGFDEYWCGAMRSYEASHALDGTPFADAPRTVVDRRFRITVQT